MDKAYQVFVSSTFEDLKEERQQVSNNLAKAGYVVAGMELFPATDKQQLEYIKRIIDRSDYYVVIVAGRYGSVGNDNVSFTEAEFEYAKSKRIPILAFLHARPKEIAVGKTDEDSTKAERLEKFRQKLQSDRIVEFWSDAGDLCTKVVIAVANAVNLTPGIGWVRGDQAIDPKVLQETERLRIENSELRAKVSELTLDDAGFDPKLVGPMDKLAFEYTEEDQVMSVDASVGEIFVLLYDAILSEPREDYIDSVIGQALGTIAGKGQRDLSKFYTTSQIETVKLRDQLEALGLMQPKSNNFRVVWTVTEKGRRFAASRRAVRKVPDEDE